MKKQFLIMLILVIVCTSCTEKAKKIEKPTTSEKLDIYVSNYPLFYFAQRIGADKIRLHFPAEKMADPSYWKPVADSVAAMQQADLIFLNGASYEKWLMNVSMPEDKVVDTSKKFSGKLLESGESFSHSHGNEGAHEHKGTAANTWLDLSLAAQQAEVIKEALVSKYPKAKAIFEGNYEKLENDLLGLHRQFTETVANGTPVSVVFSHPVYQYFQRAYGLKAPSLHWEPYEQITKDQLHELEHLSNEQAIECVIWEDAPLPESNILLKKKGVKSRVINAGSGTPKNGDYLAMMKQNLNVLRELYATD